MLNNNPKNIMENPDPTQLITIAEHQSALASQQADFDKNIVNLQAQLSAVVSTAADDAKAKQAQIDSLTSQLAEAISHSTSIRNSIAELGNEQRNAIDSAITALQAVKAINTRALADDDARKIAEQKAEAQAKLAELDKQRATLAELAH